MVFCTRSRKIDNKNVCGGVVVSVFILAHILADFVFQKESVVEARKQSLLKGNLKHAAIVCAFFLLAGISYIFLGLRFEYGKIIDLFIFISLNVFFHFIIDYVKSKIIIRLNKNKFYLFLIDQILHLTILIISFNLIFGTYQTVNIIGNQYILLLIFLFIATFVSSVIIKEILNVFHLGLTQDNKENSEIENNSMTSGSVFTPYEHNEFGKWIGIIERAIMFLSIYLNIWGLLSIVVVFKTFTRLEGIKKNPEYYIIGNLLSILFVIVIYSIFSLVS